MPTKSLTAAKLEAEINTALEKLENLEKTSEEYGTIVDRIAQLHKLKIEEEQSELKTEEVKSRLEADSKLKPPTLDTALIVAANLFGIFWITRYERTGVITTKAFGNIMKLPR